MGPRAGRAGAAVKLTRWQERGLLFVLAAVQVLHILDFVLMMPLGPQLMRLFGISPARFGMLVSAYSFSAAVFGIVNALYVDRLDRRTALLGFYAGFTLATLACAYAPSYHALLAARIMAGGFGGSLGATVFAVIGDAIPVERRATATGIVMSAFAVASVAGVPIGLALAARGGWQLPFMVLAAASFVVWLLAARLLPHMGHHRGEAPDSALAHLARVATRPAHLRAFAFVVAVTLAGFSVIPYLSPYLVANVGVAEGDLAWVYFCGGAATVVTSQVIGRMADRLGKRRVFVIVAAASMIPLLLATHLPRVGLGWALASSTLFMVLVSGRFVPAMALVTGSAEARVRGSFLSLNTAVQQLASGSAAMIGSAFLSRGASGEILGYGTAGWFACAATLAALALARRLHAVS